MAEHDPLCLHGPFPRVGCVCALIARARADERSHCDCTATTNALDIERAALLADLREQVDGLAIYLVDDQSEPGGPSIIHHAVSLESVLALIDEAQP